MENDNHESPPKKGTSKFVNCFFSNSILTLLNGSESGSSLPIHI